MINEGIKINERGEKKRIFLCKTTWTFKFTVLKKKLVKNKLLHIKIHKPRKKNFKHTLLQLNPEEFETYL